MKKIKCNSINYRKGFIEITGGIHSGCINIEAWNIHPDLDISSKNATFDCLPEDAVTGNTELEMSVKDAEELLQVLQEVICKATRVS